MTLSCRGGLHESPMLVSDLASARKFMGWPGTGWGWGEEQKWEAAGVQRVCPAHWGFPFPWKGPREPQHHPEAKAVCLQMLLEYSPLFLLLLFSQGPPTAPRSQLST